jgi:hypothetical protein
MKPSKRKTLLYQPESNWRIPANLADPEFSMSVIQQHAVAVSPTIRDNVAPVPVNTVVALHHPLGIAQKLKE